MFVKSDLVYKNDIDREVSGASQLAATGQPYTRWCAENGFNAHCHYNPSGRFGHVFWRVSARGNGIGDPLNYRPRYLGCQIQTAKHTSITVLLQQLDTWVSEFNDCDLLWVFMEQESAWTDDTERVYNHLVLNHPQVRVVQGPFGGQIDRWDQQRTGRIPSWNRVNIPYCYPNVTRRDRQPWDVAKLVAELLSVGYEHDNQLVAFVCPQVVEDQGGGKWRFSDAEDYRIAMNIAARSMGGMMWANDLLYAGDALDPGRFANIHTWQCWHHVPLPPKDRRLFVPVFPGESQTWREVTSLCRVIWRAGYVPHGVVDGDTVDNRRFISDEFFRGTAYDYRGNNGFHDRLQRYYDWNHPGARLSDKVDVIRYEGEMARRLRNSLTQQGIDPTHAGQDY